jgi:hypothetical protein
MSQSVAYYKNLYLDGQSLKGFTTDPVTDTCQLVTAGGSQFTQTGSEFHWQKVGQWIQFEGFAVWVVLPPVAGPVYLVPPQALTDVYPLKDNVLCHIQGDHLPTANQKTMYMVTDELEQAFILEITTDGVDPQPVISSQFNVAGIVYFSGRYRTF